MLIEAQNASPIKKEKDNVVSGDLAGARAIAGMSPEAVVLAVC